jgi:hypothetical protein
MMADHGCQCYRCTTPVYSYTEDGIKYIKNNLHGELRPCETCGRPKSEYSDHGAWGEYTCWWCNTRTADPHDT